MADDQKPKTMDINDLVRELSKSSTSPAAPSPVLQTPKPITPSPMAGSSPAPFMPKPPVSVTPTPPPAAPSQPKPLETPRPQFNVPPKPFSQPSQPLAGQVKPAPVPPPAAPLPTPGVKEYQSSIRTMNEDISNLKQGQRPTGIDIPRKVEQVVSVPQPMPSKPAMPSQQFKVPNVNLGETQKTAPMAPSKEIPRFPSAPKVEQKPQIYVPQEGQKGGNRNMLFIGIGAVAIVAGFSYWFFVLRSPAPEVVIESPTPIATETPTPTPTLNSIFSGAQKQGISISPTAPLSFFVGDVTGKVVVDQGTFKVIEATDTQTPGISYSFTDLLAKLALSVPSELVSNFGNDSAMFVYGQQESFDSKGNLQVGVKAPNGIEVGVVAPNKIVIIAELKSSSDASQTVNKWEATLSSDLKVLFTLGNANKNQPGFLDNSYRGVAIRYRNFPYPDKSIDYSVVPALNGKSYLVISGSREAMYVAIGKLNGL